MSLLEFPATFFDGEEREGFYVEPIIKRAWAAEMEVLEHVKEICWNYGIKYFADYGTLLGAVRHRGFIPWDDDIDLCMFRKDAMRFVRVARENLPAEYNVFFIRDSGSYDQSMIKVLNSDKIRVNDEFFRENHGFPFVTGIDIFILDNIPDDEDDYNMYVNLLNLAKGMVMAYGRSAEEFTDEKRAQITQALEKTLNIQFDYSGEMIHQAAKLMDSLSAMYIDEKTKCVGSVFELTHRPKEQVARPIEWYDDVIIQPFETVSVPIPIGYHEHLAQEYGDYMKPEIRPAHKYPYFRDQMRILKEWLADHDLTLKDIQIPDITQTYDVVDE